MAGGSRAPQSEEWSVLQTVAAADETGGSGEEETSRSGWATKQPTKSALRRQDTAPRSLHFSATVDDGDGACRQESIKLSKSEISFKFKEAHRVTGATQIISESARKRQVAEQREQIKAQLKMLNRGIVHPRRSRWYSYWDVGSFLFLIYTAIITPVEIAMVVPSSSVTPLFLVNRVVDLFFSLDLLLNFFVAHQLDPKQGGRWVTKRGLIAAHYARGWFLPDLLSVLPFDLLIFLGAFGTSASDVRLIRLIRLVRLAKLLRLLRASRLIARWQSALSISYATVALCKWTAYSVFAMHLLACVWAYAAVNYVTTDEPLQRTTWIIDNGLEEATVTRLYARSFYTACLAVFGSVGSIVPTNSTEYVLLTSMLIVGSLFWSWVIGSICGALATLNPHIAAHQNTMDALNRFIVARQLQSSATRVRDYFISRRDYSEQLAADQLLRSMSLKLRRFSSLQMSRLYLGGVWWLRPLSPHADFIADIAVALGRVCFAALEEVPVRNLSVVIKVIIIAVA